jgi:DNA-3-methyladenine glycosylase II
MPVWMETGDTAWNGQDALRHLASVDEVMGRLIRTVGPYTLVPKRPRHPFQSLATSILYQQLNGKAAATIVGRFVERMGERGRFPTPERVARATLPGLRKCGISGSKGKALKDLARRTLAGGVPSFAQLLRMEDEAIVECLTEVRGIGRWTVEMLLMFRLGRPDVLPVTDFGVRKGFGITYGMDRMPTPQEVADHGERWKPHRTVASWYLWRATDLNTEAGKTWP